MMCWSSSTTLLWILSTVFTVSLGNIVPTDLYGIKGQSMYLDFAASFSSLTHPKFLLKRENGNVLVKDNKVAPSFSKKVHYFSGNFSIRLNHLNDIDGGIYEGYDQQEWNFNHLFSYKVVILDAVPKPHIQVRPSRKDAHGNSSWQNCSFLVNCSSSSSWKTYNCDRADCTLLGSSPIAKVNITLRNDNGSIKCIVSNPASTKSASKQLPETCIEDNTEEMTRQSPHDGVVIIIAIAIAAGLLLVCVTLIVIKRCAVKSKETPQKPMDIPTVIVTGSDADKRGGQEANSVYSVVNKSARCFDDDGNSSQTSHTNRNKTSRSTSAEVEHRSPRQQKTKGKQCPPEDNSNMTIYTTATKPRETQRPTVDNNDTTIYTMATKPLEEQQPLKDTGSTVYDAPTARPRQIPSVSPDQASSTTQTAPAQPDSLYYTLGHMGTGL